MKNIIKNFKIEKLENPNYVKPIKLSYNVNNKNKTWEAVECFDSVSILLFDKQREAFLLVKQFRAPVYLNDKKRTFTYELCAGIIDKDKDLKIIAKEEVDEECGYDICVESIEKIAGFFSNVGVSGSKSTLFFANINDEMKIHEGGGIKDEEIELYFLPLKEVRAFIFDESKTKTSGLILSFYWFFEKYKNYSLI